MRGPTLTSILGMAAVSAYYAPPRRYLTQRKKAPKPGRGRRRYDKRKYRRQRAGYRTWMKGQR